MPSRTVPWLVFGLLLLAGCSSTGAPSGGAQATPAAATALPAASASTAQATPAPATSAPAAPESSASRVVPPPGEVWFGTGWDEVALSLQGRTKAVSATAETAVVATFPEDEWRGLTLQALKGSTVIFEDKHNQTGPYTFEETFPLGDFGVTGPLTIQFRDAANKVVASGTVTVQP